MKKTFLLLLIILLLLTGCKTKEEIEQEKEQQRINDITKEVEKNTEVPEDVKKWLVDNKTKQVLTIFCMSISKRCELIEKDIKQYEDKIKVHYIDFYEMEDSKKEAYKNAYELKDYTGYLPYVFIVKNDKLIDYEKDVKSIDDIKKILVKNKIVSE